MNAFPESRVRAGLAAWLLFAALPCGAQAPAEKCGEVVTLETRARSSTRYAFAQPVQVQGMPIALVLLAGGPGYLDLDDNGCARLLAGNSLVRSMPLFQAAGFFAALVDAPSDHHGEDGLGGFRVAEQHAQDLGRVIADVRARSKGQVWLVGTSRGAISAANGAARLTAASAPDGVVLTSALMAGQAGAKKSWVAHSVFDLPLEAIRVPVLVVGHAADLCVRSPAGLMGNIVARTSGVREQVVTVTGGPVARGGTPSVNACEGRSPHGFVDQEAEVAAGIARFVRGGAY